MVWLHTVFAKKIPLFLFYNLYTLSQNINFRRKKEMGVNRCEIHSTFTHLQYTSMTDRQFQ